MGRQPVLNSSLDQKKEYKSTKLFQRNSASTMLRLGLLVMLLIIFVIILPFFGRDTISVEGCLGVPMLSEEDMGRFQNYVYRDYSENIRFQSEFAAIDEKQSIIYITQKIDADTQAEDLVGSLSLESFGSKMYFAPDDRWSDLKSAVQDGHGFKLLIEDRLNTYMEYEVVFTTLPVMSIHGNVLYKADQYLDVFSGRMTLWDSEYITSENMGTTSSNLHWHIRGGSSKNEPKKSYKVSLKNTDNKNNSESLLELGTDDDWILNSMNMEDSNIREKLFMDLWNEMAAQTDYNYPMSTGKYVEVLINGEYCGLYLLQRRVDTKYLNLTTDDILMKVNGWGEARGYEFVSNILPEDAPAAVLDAFFFQQNSEALDKRNFIDVSLFLNYFSAGDNVGNKNMFYIIEKHNTGYRISLIPWDTDLTMASIWIDGVGFGYDYELSMEQIALRQELRSMQKRYPNLDEDVGSRWLELRKTVFSEEHITDAMDGYLELLDGSGAVNRDQEKWGLFYGGEDTIENLYRFAEERLQKLDEYYAQ